MLALALPAGAAAEDGVARLVGHGGPVTAAAVTADGRALTGSFDNSVGLWELATGEVRWLEGHEAAVKAVIALPGDRAASAGDDFDVILWDLALARPLARLEGHEGPVAGLALSPDGVRLASAGWDRRVGLWSLHDGRLIRWLDAEAPVEAVAFAEDGRLVVGGGQDGALRVWEAETGAERPPLAQEGFAITELLVDDATGQAVFGTVDGRLRAISLADGAPAAEVALGRRPVLALAAAADVVVFGDGEGHVTTLDRTDWSVRSDARVAAQGPVWALALTPDGGRIVAGGLAPEALVWEAEGEPPAASAPSPAPAALSEGERRFAAACAACHSLTPDHARKAGPSLAGLFGRPAGTVDGYAFSDALRDSGVVWTAETLDRLFDLGPAHYVPGSKMPMQRIGPDAHRAELIEFLAEATR